MTDNTCSLETQEGRPAIFGVIDPLLEPGKCSTRKQVPGLGDQADFFYDGGRQVRPSESNVTLPSMLPT